MEFYKINFPVCLKRIAGFIIVLFVLIHSSFAQSTELDLSFGSHFSKSAFHHNSKVNTTEDQKFDNTGRHYHFGIASKLSDGIYLRSELGLISTNSFFSIDYDYDEGLGLKQGLIISWLNNQKIYFGLLPEYRISKNDLHFYFHGGILISSDINNSFITHNQVLLPRSTPIGLKLGGGFGYQIKNIGFRTNLGYTAFGKSRLYNIYHPYISYRQINATIGLVYVLGKED